MIANEEKMLDAHDRLSKLVYQNLLREGMSPIEVAPLLIKVGLELYKTVLSDEDYDNMVDFISENRNEVKDLTDITTRSIQ